MWFDPKILEVLSPDLEDDSRYDTKAVSVSQLITGMILDENVVTTAGLLIIAKGQEITPSLKAHLENFHVTSGVREPIKVLLPINKSQ